LRAGYTIRCLTEQQLYSLSSVLGTTNNPWSTVVDKLIVAHLLKKLFAFYGTRKFITMFNKSPPLDPILSQMNPADIFTPSFFQTHLNIILPSTILSPEFVSSRQVFRLTVCTDMHLSSVMRIYALTSHPPGFDHPNNI